MNCIPQPIGMCMCYVEMDDTSSKHSILLDNILVNGAVYIGRLLFLFHLGRAKAYFGFNLDFFFSNP